MERPPSNELDPSSIDDQLDSLVNLLKYQDAPQGLDDLLPANLDLDLNGILKAEFSDSDPSRLGSASFAGFQAYQDRQPDDDQNGDGKRRRRIRNAKQQELNRLAQQRYRQRKKQKYSDLQSTVDELNQKMAIILRLEGEAEVLKQREAAVQSALRNRDAALVVAQATVQQQAVLLEQQRQQISKQQQQLEAAKLQQQQGCAPSPPPCPSASAEPQQPGTGPDQSALYDRLVSALRSALSEVCQEQGLHASSAAQEQVLLRFRRSLSSCCSEVLATANQAAVTAAAAALGRILGAEGQMTAALPLLQGVAQQVAGGAAVAAAVALVAAGSATAAGQVQDSTHRVSVTCC